MKATSSTSADSQDWKKKYFDSLTSLETEQRQFKAMETVLKRLASRLCIASLGQSPQLDNELKRLQTAMRKEADSDELDKIAASLTGIIQTLDQSAPRPAVTATSHAKSEPVPVNSNKTDSSKTDSNKSDSNKPSSPEPIADDRRLRAVLAALLVELRRDSELLIRADELDRKLSQPITAEQLPDILASFNELVGLRIHRIERAKQEIEALLAQMVGRLDEIGQFVAEHTRSQNQSLANSETLNIQLAGEMKAMGESVEKGDDLMQIRLQVRSRLDSIDRHLQEFRARETERVNAIASRNEHMQRRVVELEAEANRLHAQLKEEQRLSTIDALTNVSNRLAYEKRIEEELQRWQRFKQPTCVAVWDVDRFKSINDTYGHRAGDKVLRAVADCLAKQIRSTDFLARYGGEEFVMILCGTQSEDALRIVDQIRIGVSQLKLHSSGTPLHITISCGLTALAQGDSAIAVFERADKALYKAKDAGRNRCVVG